MLGGGLLVKKNAMEPAGNNNVISCQIIPKLLYYDPSTNNCVTYQNPLNHLTPFVI